MSDPAGQIAVFIEPGKMRVFASALDWPGWARPGKTEEAAVMTLTDYLPRYAPIVARAGLRPPDGDLVVAERHPGVAGTRFGSLGELAARESGPLPADAGDRLAVLLEAAWAAFDETHGRGSGPAAEGA